MQTVILTKWGNSIGIRIPSAIIKEVQLRPGEELTILVNKKGDITLIPIKNPQEGWTEAFNAIADSTNNDIFNDLTNKFDEEDWTW